MLFLLAGMGFPSQGGSGRALYASYLILHPCLTITLLYLLAIQLPSVTSIIEQIELKSTVMAGASLVCLFGSLFFFCHASWERERERSDTRLKLTNSTLQSNAQFMPNTLAI